MPARTQKALLSFNRGVVSPLLDSRLDLGQVAHAARTCHNMVVEREGAATRRNGTRFIAEARTGGNVENSTIIVELWHGYHWYLSTPIADGLAYEVFFGGTATISPDGSVRFVGSIRASTRGLHGTTSTVVPYRVLVNGVLTTVASAQANFNAVAVDYTLPAGSIGFLRFPCGYVHGDTVVGFDFGTTASLNLMEYPAGGLFNIGGEFPLPKDPTLLATGNACDVSVVADVLTMVGTYKDGQPATSDGGHLHTYAIADLDTANRTAQIIHINAGLESSGGFTNYTRTRPIGSRPLVVFLSAQGTAGVESPLGVYLGPFS